MFIASRYLSPCARRVIFPHFSSRVDNFAYLPDKNFNYFTIVYVSESMGGGEREREKNISRFNGEVKFSGKFNGAAPVALRAH